MIDRTDWRVIERLQAGVPLCAEPFAAMAAEVGLSEGDFLQRAHRLQEAGVLRRIAPRVRHGRLGVRGNLLVAWQAPPGRCQELGELFAACPQVSHCYLRPPFEGFPYNLYTMVHGRDEETARATVEELAKQAGLREYTVLRTVRELKKTAPRYEAPPG